MASAQLTLSHTTKIEIGDLVLVFSRLRDASEVAAGLCRSFDRHSGTLISPHVAELPVQNSVRAIDVLLRYPPHPTARLR